MKRDYQPCRSGIHICGADEDRYAFFTEANFDLGPASARFVFDRVKAECSAREGEPKDFVVDLMRGGDIIDDFAVSRQMVARIAGIVAAWQAEA